MDRFYKSVSDGKENVVRYRHISKQSLPYCNIAVNSVLSTMNLMCMNLFKSQAQMVKLDYNPTTQKAPKQFFVFDEEFEITPQNTSAMISLKNMTEKRQKDLESGVKYKPISYIEIEKRGESEMIFPYVNSSLAEFLTMFLSKGFQQKVGAEDLKLSFSDMIKIFITSLENIVQIPLAEITERGLETIYSISEVGYSVNINDIISNYHIFLEQISSFGNDFSKRGIAILKKDYNTSKANFDLTFITNSIINLLMTDSKTSIPSNHPFSNLIQQDVFTIEKI